MKALYSLCIILTAFLCSATRAETVITTRAHALHGKVVAQTPEWIELNTEFGTLRIARENIARIEQDAPAMEAEGSEPAAHSKDSAEKMMAEGKLLYHGRWVTPEEKAAQEEKIAEARRLAAEHLAEKKRLAREEAARDAEARASVEAQKQAEERRYFIRHQAFPAQRDKLMNSPDYR